MAPKRQMAAWQRGANNGMSRRASARSVAHQRALLSSRDSLQASWTYVCRAPNALASRNGHELCSQQYNFICFSLRHANTSRALARGVLHTRTTAALGACCITLAATRRSTQTPRLSSLAHLLYHSHVAAALRVLAYFQINSYGFGSCTWAAFWRAALINAVFM